MQEERVRKISPEERQRRIEKRRRQRKKNAVINISFLAVTAVCFVVFIIYIINYFAASAPNNNAEKEIENAKTAISESETQIQTNTEEKDSLQKAVDDLRAELEKYNDD